MKTMGNISMMISLALIVLSQPSSSCKPSKNVNGIDRIEKIEIPFRLIANVIILPIRIADSREFRVILDTGMHFEGLLLYNLDPEDSVTLDNPVEVLVPGAGRDEPSTALMADSMSFYVGKLECKDQRIIVLQNNRMEGMLSEGVTGYSLFGKYIVEIDYERMIITLHESPFTVDSSWEFIPMTFKTNNIPWIEGTVNVNGEEEMPASFYIDLASPDALELLVKEDMKFRLPDSLEEAYLGTGLSGDIYGQTGRIASLKLGSFRLEDVTTSFAPADVRSKQDNADGIIGSNSLRRFNVIFDYKGCRLYLKPNTHFNEPF
ncbi:MAG: retropepsin-like domain-containing protein [candidate division WOR-3 bacterium]|nr:MAG: retropepsin-like domain-containing protein [candidate division WOR-3 bacterium]